MLRYLDETQKHRVFFKYQQDASVFNDDQVISIDGYCDADWGNCPDTRKSVTGYTMMLAGGPVAWAARRQSIVALSTAEAEYAASCEACHEGRAMLNLLVEVLQNHVAEFKLGVDNQAAAALASRPSYSRKPRHIELRYHYVRKMVNMKIVKMWKVDGDANPADLFTKPLGFARLNQLKSPIGMQPEIGPAQRELQRE
ncbi:hypothetical protein PR001_g18999 [Phytophthora rubi]|uniref:Reverse transcriptase Ty1/copia-type domain-containing protein n=2 Tax=Phytophthora rubi TaxID=129364 RepID=A0A6A3K4N5_9STRA|nr:hypothetical protein PR001_g18999 [Phytophthora rubi]